MEMLALCGLLATLTSLLCVGVFAIAQLWLGERDEVGNE